MKTMRRACSMMAAVVLVATATSAPADARGKGSGDEAVGRTITKVQLVRGGKAAKVTIEMVCSKGETFWLFVEVIQDNPEVEDGVLDAYYSSKKLVEGSCTGRKQRFRVLTVPDLGGFSSPDSRLKKGPASETIGGELGGAPEVTTHEVPVR